MTLFIDPSCAGVSNFEKLIEIYEVKEKSRIKEGESVLLYEDDVLKINSNFNKPIFCDFLSSPYLREVQQGYGRSEAIFKFLKSSKPLSVLDLTLGYGRDFFKGVLCGHDMIGIERDPVIFSLVEDGIKRFHESTIVAELRGRFRVSDFKAKILNLDSKNFLNTCDQFDLIFYDPMFDTSSKSGKTKKSIQLLRDVIGSDSDKEIREVIDLARKKANEFIFKCDAKFEVDKEQIKSVHKGKGYKFINFKPLVN